MDPVVDDHLCARGIDEWFVGGCAKRRVRDGGEEMEREERKEGRKTVYPFLRARNFHRKSACRATATAVAARAISIRSTRSAVGVGILRLILRTAAVAAVSGTEPWNAAAAADRICREEMCSRAADVA